MAEGSNLSGSVMEDAVPLESMTRDSNPRPPGGPRTPVSHRPPQRTTPGRGELRSSQLPEREETLFHSKGTARGTAGEQTLPQTRAHASGARGFSPSLPQALPQGLPAQTAQGKTTVSPSQRRDDDLQHDILKGVKKASGKTEREILSVLNPSLSSFSSATPSLATTVESMGLEDIDDEEIEKFRSRFPDDIKIDHYDALILYHDSDMEAVKKFLERVNHEILLNNKEKPKVVLYGNMFAYAGTKPGELDISLEHCTYVFLYVTQKFCDDKWTEFSAQTALMNAIDSTESRWSVVPIFTEPKRKPTFKIPATIRSLKGIQYWNDDKFYVDSLRKLLEDKLHWRLDKEVDLKRERKRWIMRFKEKERRKAELRKQEDLQAEELEAEKDRKHQQRMRQRETEHREQCKISINRFEEEYCSPHYQGNNSSQTVSGYIASVCQQLQAPNSSSAEQLISQGTAEQPSMLHSRSMPSRLGDPYPAISYQPDLAGKALPQRQILNFGSLQYFPQGSPPDAFQSQATSLAPGSTSGVSFHLQESETCSKSNQPVQTASGVNLQGAAKDTPDTAVQSGGAGQPSEHHQGAGTAVSQSSPLTGAELTGTLALNRSVLKEVVDTRNESGTSDTGDTLTRTGPDGCDRSLTIKEPEKNSELPPKDDLVEDVPLDSRRYQGAVRAPPYPHRPSQYNPPHFSEAVQHQALVSHGPAHRSGNRVCAEPVGMGSHGADPRLMYGGSAGVGARFPGQVPPSQQYVTFQPAFPGHIPQGYAPTPPFYGQLLQGYPAGQLDYSAPGPFPPYGMYPVYGGIPYYHPQAGLPAHRLENLQYPPQYAFPSQPSQAPRPQPPAPPRQPQPQPQPRPAQLPEDPHPAVFHHHHYHHSSGGDEVPATTINYIKKAETVMVGNEITMGKKTRRPDAGDGACARPDPGDVVLPQPAPEDMLDPSGNQPYHFENPPASSNPARGEPSSYSPAGGREAEGLGLSDAHSSRSTLTAFREHPHPSHNPSRLTQNVSRDDRSRQTSALSSELPPPEGLPELFLESGQMYMGLPPPSHSSPSSSDQHHPLQGQDHRQASLGPVLGMGPDLQQWVQRFEQDRDTELKQYIVGPSTEDESSFSEDAENTTLKMRGSKA
ncbi:uncharacterized protein LOC143282007 [Babylonia areolata]|uniref:uncharacterized protein LOC143282007 n=1 Tax=Babylonia areolata TaxID=304850 RepID=UPI003FD11D8E